MQKKFDLKENLKILPDKPGVYIHKDEAGEIIYVGKAISLKNRIRQYFRSKKGLDPKVKALMSHIREFEYIVTDNEMEALLLEAALIKKHMPKYNVLLRDDKSFPYIKLTVAEEWPTLIKTRRLEDDGNLYFGPYTDGGALTQLIDLLSDIYGLKRCNAKSFPQGFKPCLNFHIEKCSGLCAGLVDNAEYRKSVEEVAEFLSGNTKGVLKILEEKMKEASDNLEYEQAADYRDKIAAVKAVPDQERLDNFINKIKRNKVKVVRRKAEETREAKLARLKEIDQAWETMGLRPPKDFQEGSESFISRIESYDISHIGGQDAVGALVVYVKGEKSKKDYRRFRIRMAEGSGDTDSLKEVLSRRMKRALEEAPGFEVLPDLILVDGGKNQVNAVEEVLSLMMINIPVIGMVKDEKHKTRGLIYRDVEYDLKNLGALRKFIGEIQEEVHRFALDYHRGLRAQGLKKSELDEIPGIGPKRKAALLREFRSLKAIKNASLEELVKVDGLTEKTAENVYKHFHNDVVKHR